jgi:hypothetical protein
MRLKKRTTADSYAGRASRELSRYRELTRNPLEEKPAPTPAASEAGRRLARRWLRKHGKDRLVEMGSNGGKKTWSTLTYEERSIEMRRRRRLGMARKKAKIEETIKRQVQDTIRAQVGRG